MKWVKIEDGCEMPENGEVVLLCDDEGDWCQACRTAGGFVTLEVTGIGLPIEQPEPDPIPEESEDE